MITHSRGYLRNIYLYHDGINEVNKKYWIIFHFNAAFTSESIRKLYDFNFLFNRIKTIKTSFLMNTNRSSFDACEVIGCTSLSNTTKLGFWSYTFCLIFALLSFSACSPHFVVNSLTVFCCSMAFGMSMSVESLENIRRTTSVGIFSIVKPRRLNTLVIGHILVGQLVGGSGGKILIVR